MFYTYMFSLHTHTHTCKHNPTQAYSSTHIYTNHCYIVYYIYKQKVLNIGDRAYFDVSLEGGNAETTAICNSQFFTSFASKRESTEVGILSNTAVYSTIRTLFS